MKDKFNSNNSVNEDSEKAADFTEEDIKTSFGAHSRPPEEEDENISRKPGQKHEWEQTTDSPEETAGDTVTNILTNEPEFPEDGNEPLLPLSLGNKADDGSPEEPKERVSSYITIERKNGQPPKDKVLLKALEQAVEQGWEKIYVFGKNNRTPDLEVAQYIQSFIEKNNLAGKISCCCDPGEYKSAGSARKIHKNNLRSGAKCGKDMDFK